MAKTLTDKRVKAAKGPEKIADATPLPGGGRLVLIVRSPTVKSWVLRTRRGGRDSTVKIGEYPTMGIAAARAEALKIANGSRPDPRVPGGSLRRLIEAYIESLGERPSARDARWAAGWLFGKNWEHELSRRPAHLVEPHELAALLRAKHALGATVSVNRARSMLSAAFKFGANFDLDPRRPEDVPTFAITVNPVTLILRMDEFEIPREVRIERADMNAIWNKLVALGPKGAFGRLAILSLQRLAQLRTATIEDGHLVIRDTKGRGAKVKINHVPITKRMAEAIRDGALDLPGGYAALNLTLRPYGFRSTDLRRTAETFLSERGVSGEDRGYLLSHGLDRDAMVRKTYDFAQRLPRKAELLTLWEKHVIRASRRSVAPKH